MATGVGLRAMSLLKTTNLGSFGTCNLDWQAFQLRASRFMGLEIAS